MDETLRCDRCGNETPEIFMLDEEGLCGKCFVADEGGEES